MSSQIEKLHILNLFAKRLRDCRITLKTYLFDFQKSKDKDFETDFPALSDDIELFSRVVKELLAVGIENLSLIPEVSEISELVKISRFQITDFYIEINYKKLSIYVAKNKYEKVMYYIYRIKQKSSSENISLEAAFEKMRNNEYSNYSELQSYADTLGIKIDKLSNLIIVLHKVMKVLSTLQVQIYTLKSIIISNSTPIPIGYQYLDQTYNYILFRVDKYIFHQPTRFSKDYLSDVLDLPELDIEYIASTDVEPKLSLSEAFTLFLDSSNVVNENFKIKYGLEIGRLANYSILDDWIYDESNETGIYDSVFLPNIDSSNEAAFV